MQTLRDKLEDFIEQLLISYNPLKAAEIKSFQMDGALLHAQIELVRLVMDYLLIKRQEIKDEVKAEQEETK